MGYTIQLPIFEGPFDLLLHLIKMEEMDIYDIPIADIAEKYLEYIREMQALDLEMAGEYLVIASQLVSMKAKTLLPLAEDDPLDHGDAEDEDAFPMLKQSPREFMRQLVAYRKFKEMARDLGSREDDALRVHYRNVAPERPPANEPEEEMHYDLNVLLDAFSRVLRFIDREETSHHVLAESYTVEDKILQLEAAMAETPGQAVDLVEQFGRCVHKIEMIVTFLAILELARLKRIRVVQEGSFGRIHLQPLAEAESEAQPSTAGA